MSEKHQKILYAGSVLIFLLFCGVTTWYIGVPMVRLAEKPEAFQAWVDSFGGWSRVVLVGIVVLQVLVAMIPGEAIELAAGYAFGLVQGTLLSMIGILIGSWIIFVLVRKFGIKLVETFFSKRNIAEVSFLKNTKKARILGFLLMLIPGTPKDFLSYFAGLTGLSMKEWLVIVLIARIPSVLTSTATGAAAGQKQYVLAVIILAVTALLSIAGVLYYRKVCKEESDDQNEEKTAA